MTPPAGCRFWVQLPVEAKPSRYTTCTLTGRLLLPADQMGLEELAEKKPDPAIEAPDARMLPHETELPPEAIRRQPISLTLGLHTVIVHALDAGALPGVRAPSLEREARLHPPVRWSVALPGTPDARAWTPDLSAMDALALMPLTAPTPEALGRSLVALAHWWPAYLSRILTRYSQSHPLAHLRVAYPDGLPSSALAALLAYPDRQVREAAILAIR